MNYAHFFAVIVNNTVCCNFLIINDCAFCRVFCTLLYYILQMQLCENIPSFVCFSTQQLNIYKLSLVQCFLALYSCLFRQQLLTLHRKMILAQISLTNYKDARLKYGSLTYYDVLRLCQQTRSKHVAVSVLQDNMFQNEQQFPQPLLAAGGSAVSRNVQSSASKVVAEHCLVYIQMKK